MDLTNQHYTPVRIGNMLVGVALIDWSYSRGFYADWHNVTLSWRDYRWVANFNEVNELFWGTEEAAVRYFESKE